ncbi:NADH-ubiquinone oxidoreductase-F iron-sulfur binding region domain-containing protein [soil metagenome]|jgi:NADH:ubiquinone oxidoreductase subunit F (NADH-binding)
MTARLHSVPDETPDNRTIVGSAFAAGLLSGLVRFGDADDEPVQAPGAEDFSAHLGAWGRRPVTAGLAGDELFSDVQRSGLTGRGGGHFPVADKWTSYLSAGGSGVLVGNGAESEPLSAKDAALLQLRPHLVLDGLSCTAQAMDATQVVLWLHASDKASRRSLARAITERQAYGTVEPSVRVVLAEPHYLSGESSAIVRALSGGPTLPQFRRVSAAVSGVHDRPTLVHNVETLARIGLVARGIDPTGVLVTVSAGADRTVVEVADGTALTTAFERAGLAGDIAAVLVGGYGGRWLTYADFAPLRAGQSRKETGVSIGAGVLRAVRSDECGLRVASDIATYLAESSARQCGPCLFGLASVADLLRSVAKGSSRRRERATLGRQLNQIAGRGACKHPDGAVGMISSALEVFSEDAASHVRRGRCLAEVG